MTYRMKKPPMRIVVSIVAVLLVAVVVPFSTMVADGMNGMIGEKTWTKTFDSLDDYQSNVPIYRMSESNYGHVFSYVWDENTPIISQQMIITPSVNGHDYSELVISNENFTDEVGAHHITFQLDYSPEKWLDDGATSIDIDLAMESDKTIAIRSDGSYAEKEHISGWAPVGLTFSGVSNGKLIQAHIPVCVSSEYEEFVEDYTYGQLIHVTDEFRTFSINLENPSDIIRAMTYLKDCDYISMSLTLSTSESGTGEIFENGDYLKYRITVIGDTVSGYAVGNVFVGILGVSLIVGAVFATPWVGKGTFSNNGRIRRRSGSRRRRW
jgi:hypothetical protein